ncbi:MAG TPA: hypothetical protein VEU30_11160, partial [Thermoanaerobaculia bacterium]|nr:hypothetical protein [Thermoanaerobaculia bacterium]
MKKLSLLLSAAACAAVIGCATEEEDTVPRKVGARAVLPRVSGQTQWGPCRRIPKHPEEVVADVQCGAPVRECPRRITSHKDANQLLSGCSTQAIEFLADVKGASAEVQSDLAAAYYVRAQKARSAIDLLYALRAADAAVAANDNLAAAHFNRALAQEAFGLDEEAIASLMRVQRLERDPQWAGEALRRRNALVNRLRNAAWRQWPRIEKQLRAAREVGEVRALIDPYPYAAQMFAETVLLREWAVDDSRQALDLTRLIGRALERRNRDGYLVDVVAAIDAAKGTALDDLKKGHASFAEGVYLDETAEVVRAQERYREAVNHFRSAKSPGMHHAQARVKDYAGELPYPVLEIVRRLKAAYTNVEGSQYAQAAEDYEEIAEVCRRIGQPERALSAETRRVGQLMMLNQTDLALAIALPVLRSMDSVPSAVERTAILSDPALLISSLEFPDVARRLQDMHVASLQAELAQSAKDLRRTVVITRSLARAVRARGRDHAKAGDLARARRDLQEARSLMPEGDLADRTTSAILQMQWLHVLGNA